MKRTGTGAHCPLLATPSSHSAITAALRSVRGRTVSSPPRVCIRADLLRAAFESIFSAEMVAVQAGRVYGALLHAAGLCVRKYCVKTLMIGDAVVPAPDDTANAKTPTQDGGRSAAQTPGQPDAPRQGGEPPSALSSAPAASPLPRAPRRPRPSPLLLQGPNRRRRSSVCAWAR
jgi:hypothetical protein